ncbi:MAG TPA: thiamine phosphate synthase [Stenotrophobium sp.]|jgi:thiamine-phosphate pyrophosphorylase|nr:thiamine phosphate synthase [Stenotrophobium sp.]
MKASHAHPRASALRGLYAVSSETLCRSAADLLAGAAQALSGGAALIQYRDKWNDAATRARHAHALLGLCREYGAMLIINDDVELAARCGADGVHVGAGDTPLAEARARLGPEAVIGVSCSNSLERALAAQDGGADYIAFGRYFPSRTKPDAPAADAGLLPAARTRLRLPVCVIGGITPDNAPALIAQGADLVAAVEGVFGAADIEAAARAYARLFAR